MSFNLQQPDLCLERSGVGYTVSTLEEVTVTGERTWTVPMKKALENLSNAVKERNPSRGTLNAVKEATARIVEAANTEFINAHWALFRPLIRLLVRLGWHKNPAEELRLRADGIYRAAIGALKKRETSSSDLQSRRSSVFSKEGAENPANLFRLRGVGGVVGRGHTEGKKRVAHSRTG